MFDPSSAAQQRPKLRAVRGVPVNMGGQPALGLSDAKQISDKIVVTSPAFQVVFPLMDGSRSLDDLVREVGRGLTRQHLEPLVAQLDDACLLYGPKFDALVAKMRADFDSAPTLPPASTAQMTDALAAQAMGEEAFRAATPEERDRVGGEEMKKAFDEWIAKALENAPNPSFDALPKAVVAPHLDYPRGWLNYASVYGRMRVTDRPDRVVILGTNHFGEATGVCGCDKGYQTAWGVCEADDALIRELRQRLGETLFANRYDHEREHSIELHIPWIQHCLGKGDDGRYCRVFGALVHDPTVNNGQSYDGQGVGLHEFVAALKSALSALPGRTLIVSSADLSHVGPMFGDQKPMAGDGPEVEAARSKVFQHDREMLDLVRNLKPDELVAAMAWQQNPTRWCSVGNIVATMMVTEPENVEIFNYAAAMDERGMAMVSSVSMAMT